MKQAAFVLAALAATTLALAQTSPQTPADPRTNTAPQQETTPPASSSVPLSETQKQNLMKNCMQRVQADNPGASQNDVQAYCDKVIKSYDSPK